LPATAVGHGKVKIMFGAMNVRHISAHDLAALGVQDLAFVKMVSVNDEIAYAIHAADGTQMALMSDRDIAFAAIRQNGMEPVSVH
jgi:hypothetical protein